MGPDAAAKLAKLPVDAILATNSIRPSDSGGLSLRSVDVSGLLADAVQKVHTGT